MFEPELGGEQRPSQLVRRPGEPDIELMTPPVAFGTAAETFGEMPDHGLDLAATPHQSLPRCGDLRDPYCITTAVDREETHEASVRSLEEPRDAVDEGFPASDALPTAEVGRPSPSVDGSQASGPIHDEETETDIVVWEQSPDLSCATIDLRGILGSEARRSGALEVCPLR
jgi:hypothetical protein